jgi:CRISPR-associated protein Csb1
MSLNLAPLDASRLLFAVPLRPLQGQRFQPTGFPNLGAATYQTPSGTSLLVESVQSMANRLEATIWDSATDGPITAAQGLSHVTVKRKGRFLTDTMLESHRINSPYLLEGKDKKFFKRLQEEVNVEGAIDRKRLAGVLLKYDVDSLLHGVFLAKKELAGGRMRVARALGAFIEADDVRVAASGGVKNDHVNPSGSAKEGFGNVPFARDEFTAAKITLYANFDLGQVRGYQLGDEVSQLLFVLGLYKLRALVDGDLRLRTACDLEPISREVAATNVAFTLPTLSALATALPAAISACAAKMENVTVVFDDVLKEGKQTEGAEDEQGEE